MLIGGQHDGQITRFLWSSDPCFESSHQKLFFLKNFLPRKKMFYGFYQPQNASLSKNTSFMRLKGQFLCVFTNLSLLFNEPLNYFEETKKEK